MFNYIIYQYIDILIIKKILSSKKKQSWVAVSAFDKAGILGRAFNTLCSEITRISDGRLNIRLFHANELVGAFESFDVVQSGTCQMGFGSPYYWAGKSPAISFLSGKVDINSFASSNLFIPIMETNFP